MSNAAAIVAARCALLNPKVQVLADAAALSFNFVAWSESGEATRWNGAEVCARRVEDRPDALVAHRRAGLIGCETEDHVSAVAFAMRSHEQYRQG